MSSIVPAGPATARILTGVAADLIGALTGRPEGLPPARSAVLVVIDGLGAIPLRAHRGHARFLAAAMGKRDVARTVFPSTTASALSSLLAGVAPGEHGLVGYRVLDPDRGVLASQLDGYERDGLDPIAWQRSSTMFERAREAGLHPYAVSLERYATTGLTRAIMRGAEFVGEKDPAQRLRVSIALAEQHPGALVYCYLPELDQAGHKHGIASPAWVETLERLDAALRAAERLPSGVGMIVTADHGMIDVPPHRHVLLRDGDPRLEGVAHLGGEPRMLHVYAEPGVDVDALAGVWREASAGTADVATREEAIAAGLFGSPVAPHVRGRIGDVLVAARGLWAFYDDRLDDKASQRMIGQHGSTSPEEMIVPFIRLGAFAA
ncbi:alkaline phosphatase family protein [Microbacterium sediminis]|uniref:Uncharacterized protein n=1 Tax=Microbacterium sediminis TaxID=904291 RepID=A0A1B9N8Z0_9MICO|nr:nucleotide pyrophosphatase/phosphodiesterase family protein [Microbacterium sediminis]OCG73072.1 hypothetical protein A7J15_08930 [Microbacterium sediminis]QBR74421.1 alkaline phosphatase family protein [Microbacterium sediminis]